MRKRLRGALSGAPHPLSAQEALVVVVAIMTILCHFLLLLGGIVAMIQFKDMKIVFLSLSKPRPHDGVLRHLNSTVQNYELVIGKKKLK